MDILIISHFGSTYSEYDNDRFLYIAKKLVGHDVEIVTSDFCHEKKNHRNKAMSDHKFDITFIHEPGYKKNICLKRFYSHFIFGKNLIKYIKNRKKPDVIYCAVPSLSGSAKVANFCKKNGVRFIVDVQDIWPEAFKLVFNIPILSNVIFYPFYLMNKRIYRNASYIVGVSDTYVKKALSYRVTSCDNCSVFLGTDLKKFDLYKEKYNWLPCEKKELWIGYCGTLGASYDLTNVIKALAIVKENNIDIKFIVFGDGPQKETFEKLAMKYDVAVCFVGRISYEKMVGGLCSCDFVVNPIMHNAAQSIINKHADYTASGLPIINTQENVEFVELIKKYNMGINCSNDNYHELSEAIIYLARNHNERIEMGKNSRKCALELFDRENTYKKLVDIICDQK